LSSRASARDLGGWWAISYRPTPRSLATLGMTRG